MRFRSDLQINLFACPALVFPLSVPCVGHPSTETHSGANVTLT